MATRTVFGLLPKFIVRDRDRVGDEFRFTDVLSLKRTPEGICSLSSISDASLSFHGNYHHGAIRNSEWSLACDFEDPSYPMSNDDIEISTRDRNIHTARETITRLVELSAIKSHTIIFPHYTVIANNDGSEAWLSGKSRIPNELGLDIQFWETRITPSVLSKLKTLFQKYKEIYDKAQEAEEQIFFAIAFFREALLQKHIFLKHILIMSSFEYLFNNNGKNITHKLSHRTAALLSSNQQSYNSICKKIGMAYETRCNFIHGDAKPTPRSIKQKSYANARKYLCGILEKLIEEVEPKSIWWDSNEYQKWLLVLDRSRFKRNGPV